MREKNLSLDLKCRVLPETRPPRTRQQTAGMSRRTFPHTHRTARVRKSRTNQLTFQDFANAALRRIDGTAQRIDRKTDSLAQIAEDAAAIRKMVEGFFNSAEKEGRVPDEQLRARRRN